MAKIPDNIVSIMMVDNAGAVVSVPVSDFVSATTTTITSAPVVIASGKQPKSEVINTTIETSIAIDADPNYLVMPNASQDNLINSVVYQSNNKIGLNTKSPSYLLDVAGDSINVKALSINNGYRISSLLVASINSTLKTIYIGDDSKLNITNLYSLLIKGLIPTSLTTKVRVLGIGDTGMVSAITMPAAGSVLFSDGVTLASDPSNFFWDDTNNRLGILTNAPAYPIDVNGVIRAQTSLITPIIGNSAGVTANNTWTYSSNVNVPLVPASATHATSKQYVDSLVLVMPTSGSVLFSNGTTIASSPANFFWDNTNNRLGLLTNTPTYPLDVNGTIRALTSIITPIIGNSAGITANDTWTYSSNVNVPVTPTDATHAASKQYVDNTALTGLKLGASIKTVAIANVSLSGLSAINGYTPVASDRILVIGQTTATQNGVYDAASGSWARSTDSDTDSELRGYQYLITAGTYINARYGNTNQSTITVGTTNITYQQISNAETDPIFTASVAFGITNTNISNWNTAYNRSSVSMAVAGTTTKTITITKQDASTVTASFTDTITSVFGRAGAIALLSSDVTTALGFTPYNSTNPNGYTTNVGTVTSVGSAGTVSGLTLTGTVTTSGSLTLGGTLSLTSGNITTGLGFTPYNASNPSGYTTNVGTVTSVAGAGTVSGLTLTGTVTTAGSLTLGGTLSLTSGNVTTALGYTPYDATTNANGYTTFATANARTSISLTTTGTSGAATYSNTTGVINIPIYQGGVTSIIAGTGISVNSATGAVTITATAGSVPTLAQVCAVGSDATGYSITATSFFEPSDIRFKTILETNPNVDLSKLDVIKFNRTHGDRDSVRYGYSAQEVNSSCPDLVNIDNEGYLSVNYTDTHTLLILSLQKRIEELERKLNAN